jgi:hypothetical protein
MANYLWGFNNNVTGTSSVSPNTIDLPTITPAGKTSNNYSTQSTTTQTSLVNVVRDFYWTYSPVGDIARAEVPRIILTERKLRTNALISQLKYSLGQAYSGGTQTLQNLQQFGSSTGATAALQNAGNKLSQFLAGLVPGAVAAGAESIASGASGLVTDTTSKIGGVAANSDTLQQGIAAAKNIGAQVSDALGQTFADDNNPTVNSSPWLAPYRNLYLTDPTGWVYVLPYFNNNQANQSNSFSDSGSVGSGPIAGAMQAAANVTNDVAGLFASLNSPAQITYIEKAKFYNYDSNSGEDITVEFPLINTGSVTYDDVVRNWQFLFLLLYQNRPGKTSQNTVDQPVIYQVEVPGVKFFPFCYIQGLNIEFVGSRRELNINVPTSSSITSDAGDLGQSMSNASGSVSIPVVIPDAYKVTISLKSMIANSKNFMQHMIGPHQLVEAGVSNGAGTVTTASGNTLVTGINVTPANGILNGLV